MSNRRIFVVMFIVLYLGFRIDFGMWSVFIEVLILFVVRVILREDEVRKIV